MKKKEEHNHENALTTQTYAQPKGFKKKVFGKKEASETPAAKKKREDSGRKRNVIREKQRIRTGGKPRNSMAAWGIESETNKVREKYGRNPMEQTKSAKPDPYLRSTVEIQREELELEEQRDHRTFWKYLRHKHSLLSFLFGPVHSKLPKFVRGFLFVYQLSLSLMMNLIFDVEAPDADPTERMFTIVGTSVALVMVLGCLFSGCAVRVLSLKGTDSCSFWPCHLAGIFPC